MSTALSPSSDTDPSVAIDSVVIRSLHDLVDLEDHVDLLADETRRRSTDADLDAGHADRRPGLEAGDVGEPRLQV